MLRRTYILPGLLLAALSAKSQTIPTTHTAPPAPTQTVAPLPAPYYNTLKINTIRTWEPSIPYSNEADVISTSRTVAQVKQATQYMDGLGRPIQTVAKGISPLGKDLVSPVVYDEFGRNTLSYLPYVATTNNGSFKTDPFTDQATFAAAQYPGEQFFYGKTEYEASPLNRPVKTLAPGNSWAGSNRGVSVSYEINNHPNEVAVFVIDNSPGSKAYAINWYQTGQLHRTVTTDEHGKRVVEYKDKEGKVILKKVEITSFAATLTSHVGWLCTYYVYDDLGNLRAVLQPKLVEKYAPLGFPGVMTNTEADELCFRYEYDERNRMIVKKVPGAGEVHMVYDNKDRLIMTQDANMRAQNKWLVTTYDFLNRPVKTYMWVNADDRATHADNTNGLTTDYPTTLQLSSAQLLTVTYYDNYDWVSGYYTGMGLSSSLNTAYTTSGDYIAPSNSAVPYAQAVVKSSATLGMVTGTISQVLEASGNEYVYTLNIYDDKGRLIQVQQASNFHNNCTVTTNQYDWSGKILRSHYKDNFFSNTEHILTKYTYDAAGRVTQVKKKIGTTEKTIASHTYDELGQLKNKELGGGTLPQSDGAAGGGLLDYTYNIRGWMTGINRGYANPNYTAEAATQNQRWFGMQLSYDFGYQLQYGGTQTQINQYNGNISGIQWQSQGSDKKRSYGFEYDAANRLLKAEFSHNAAPYVWDYSDGVDYSMVINGGYDANGNINGMVQNGLKGVTSSTIDWMGYTYQANSNKLAAVTDNITADNKLGDFTDKNTVGDDYTYDVNGNLKTDKNKKITGIEYNHLNLPVQIEIYNDDNLTKKGLIKYFYDASGNKLRKVVEENKPGNIIEVTLTNYMGPFVYESKYYSPSDPGKSVYNKLQYISHEEGRIRYFWRDMTETERDDWIANNNLDFDEEGNCLNCVDMGISPVPPQVPDGYVFDYFIKDHLGNIRMVLTDEEKSNTYLATHESNMNAAEQQLFDFNYTQRNKPIGFDSDGDNYKVSKLGIINAGRSTYETNIGTSILLKVMAGDVVNAEVFGWHQNGNESEGLNPASNIANQLIQSLFGGIRSSANAGHFATDPNITTSNFNLPANLFLENQTPSGEVNAYLNWMLLDEEQLKYVSGSSGFEELANTISGEKELLQANGGSGINITKNGYLFIFVSNRSESIPVYFDDLHITHTRGPLLEETHYYPFGLTMTGISSKAAQHGNPSNKLKYNGKEEQREEFSDGSGLEWTDYGARMYDNQIGRWHVQDLMIERHFNVSSYCYVYNNPVNYSDQFGLDTLLVDAKGRFSQNILSGGDNDVIIRVSEKERKNGAISYNKKGQLKKSHIVSENFDKQSVDFREVGEGTSVITTNDQAEKVFNFLADNTDVEFTLMNFYSNNETTNLISTSHNELSDVYSTRQVTQFINAGSKLLSHTHNHPKDNVGVPSSRRTTAIEGASGDLEAYESWSKKQGDGFKIYLRYNGVTREFDMKGHEIKPKKK